jgi:hypothetical protein
VEQLREALDYNHASGILHWKYRPDRSKAWNSRYSGQAAGWIDGRARRNLLFSPFGKIKNHRIAWAIYYGEWPQLEIDHIDRNPSNNAIANLRLATGNQNKCNSGKRKHNTSGFKGVSRIRSRLNPWTAEIKFFGGKVRLGYFATPEEAHAAYCAAAKILHGEFANFG